MKLELKREPSSDKSTLGALYIDGVFKYFALEDVVREVKIYGETAIPAGEYRVDITYSPHFKRDLPLLMDVPGYSGVRIHPGNTAADTEGCILVGMTKGADSIHHSRVAFDDLYDQLLTAHDAEEAIWIEVS